MSQFIGRKRELEILENQLKKRVASLVVLRGRRRIGKSRLIEEFSKNYKTFTFTGIPPTKETTKLSQIEEFVRQLKRQFSLPAIEFNDWGDVFWFLAEQLPRDRIILVFDEITWMGSNDPDFLGKLKTAWDNHFKKNDKLMLILCGSVSAWIEKNILCSTGFVGRISTILTLGELSLSEANQFFGNQGKNLSHYEKLKILAVTGGVPRYLEEIRPEISAEQNLKQICFSPEGFLFNEFNQIFTDIFLSKTNIYFKALEGLVEHPLQPVSLAEKIQLPLNNVFSNYLNELIMAGFLTREYTWEIKTGKPSKLSCLRLKDNYTRFYLKYILPNRHKIELNAFENKSLSSFPGWASIMGYQFENLVLNNRAKIWEILKLSPDEIVWDNPYFQKKTTKQEGCQIDYLIQTKFNTLYVCEIKFSTQEIKTNIIKEVQNKVDRLKSPKGFSYRKVLIYVNELSPKVLEADYFAQVIDFGSLLE
jgi:AAA+ ATPase superfamily predicted ATPase